MSERVGRLPPWLWLVSGVILFLATWFACRIESSPGVFYSYLPVAFALVLTYWWAPRVLPAAWAGCLLAFLVCGVGWLSALAHSTSIAAAAAVSWLLFKRYRHGDLRLPDLHHLSQYLFFGLLLPLGLISLYLTILHVGLTAANSPAFYNYFFQVLLVGLTGSVAITVPLLSFGSDYLAHYRLGGDQRPPVHERPSWTVFWGLSAWALALIFFAVHSNTRFTWPLLAASAMAVALRFGFAGAVWTCLSAICLVSLLAWSDFRHGDYSHFGLTDSAQNYLLTLFILLSVLLVGRGISDLRRTLRARMKAESALRLSNQVLAALPHGIFIAEARHPDLPLVYTNAAVGSMIGASGSSPFGFHALLSQQDEANHEQIGQLRAALALGSETTVVLKSHRPGGGLVWNELTVSPLLDQLGRITHFVGIQNDVTARERARTELEAQQQVLQRQTDMLNQTQRVARMGGWEWVIPTQTLSWTRETYLLLEAPLDYRPHPAYAFKAFDDKSRLRLEQALARSLAEREGFDLELNLVTFTKRKIWVRLSAEVELDGDRVTRLYGFIQDVEERKQAELLLEQQREWLKLYFDLPIVGLARTSHAKEWLEVNTKLSDMLGYESRELLGRSWSDVSFPDDLLGELHEFSRILSGEIEGYELDKRFVRKNGTIFYAHVTMRGVRHDDGSLAYCLTMVQDVSERMEHQAEVARLAYYDELTGLPNRRMLMDRLERELARSQRYGYLGALLFLDLDHFKHVNDSLGHPAGDTMLQEISLRLQHEIREEDTLARLGGDEFVVLLVRLGADPLEASENVSRIARKLIEAVRRPILIDGQELHTSTSIGITLFPVLADDSSSGILKQADVALYRAKEGGRNNYMFFSSSMQEAANQRLKLQNDLLRSVEKGELELELQPLVHLADGRPFAAEVLLRWRSPEYGLVAPTVFIPLAEEMGLISTMGAWVLNRSAILVKQWRAHFESGALQYLAVNISARQMQKPDFTDSVVSAIQANDIEAHWLRLEMTESLMMRDLSQVCAIMQELRARGFCFSLDDFGTGYSSLTYLKRLPLDAIKIDRSFIHDVPDNENSSVLVGTIILAAQRMGLTVLAEGVETDAQAQFLLQHGCIGGQGFRYGAPMSPSEFGVYLERSAMRGSP